MTTNKYSILFLMLLIVGCLTAVSCMDRVVTQTDENELANFQEFQQTLNLVFSEATERIERTPYVTRNTIGSSLKEAYKDVLGDQANMYQFEQAWELAVSGNTNDPDGLINAEAETLSETIIRSAESPAKAVEQFDEYLSDENLSDEDRLELIIGREYITFLTENSQAIGESLNESLVARSGDGDSDEEGDTDVQEDDGKSWWDSWGKCAAATVSGYGTGGLAGCATGAKVGGVFGPKGVLVGCAAGGAVGAISGALGGAVAVC